MFCAVKAIDREGRDTVRCCQYTFYFYLGQISVTEAIITSRSRGGGTEAMASPNAKLARPNYVLASPKPVREFT